MAVQSGFRNRWLRESAGAETLTNCGLAETAGPTVDPAAPCLDSVLKHSSPVPCLAPSPHDAGNFVIVPRTEFVRVDSHIHGE